MNRTASRLLLLSSVFLVACSDPTTNPVTPPPAIDFGDIGSLALQSGKGGFRFGAASAATQIEEANTHTDWWVWTAPEADGGLAKSTFVGDASRGYSKAIEDIALLKELGLDSYRFSMEWARIEPTRNQIDEAALQHYSDFLDALVAAGIRPIVTLHHFSNPTWIDDPRDPDCVKGPTDQNLCGFGHPQGGPLVVAEFEEHASLLASRFGDRVDEWGTLNEPINYLVAAYGIGQFPPGKKNILGDILGKFVPVARDFLSASAAAYHQIKIVDQIDADGDGSPADVGLSLNVIAWEPARNNEPSTDPIDIAARDRVRHVYHYLAIDALVDGSFDSDLDGTPDEPHPEWKNTLDWLGLQYYSRLGVTGKDGLLPVLAATPCAAPSFNFGSCLPPLDITHCVPTMSYETYPPGLYDILTDYTSRWPTLPLVVTEAGIATQVGARRAENIVRTLEQIARARDAGTDVRGYYHWSIYDNFEWSLGYAPRFGLYTVAFDGSYARSPTTGATVYGNIIANRQITSDQRLQYGGEGPMTPEPITDEPYTFCDGR